MEHLEEIWLNYRNKIIMVGVLLVGVIIVGGKVYHLQTSVNNDPFVTTDKKIPTTQKQSQVKGGKAVCVDIKGAVLHPGVYRLSGGSRINEALAAAGHETPDADMNQVNLAKQLVDAQVIYIPKKGEQIPASLSGGGLSTSATNENTPNVVRKLLILIPLLKSNYVRLRESGIKKRI